MNLKVSYSEENTWPNQDKWTDFFHPIVSQTLQSSKLPPETWVSVLLSSDNYIQNLNKIYRGKDKPTNVLSFPMDDDADNCLGDIVLAFETIDREAKEANVLFEAHVAHMMVHGVLHLLGFDHETDKEAEEMETLECRIMNQLGYDAPYPEWVN